VPGRIEGRPIAPPIVNAPHGTPLSSGDQIQLQLYRDLLQTRQRQLEDRGGPFAGVEALRNQQNLNRLNMMGPTIGSQNPNGLNTMGPRR